MTRAPVDYDALRRLAEVATPGPWHRGAAESVRLVWSGHNNLTLVARVDDAEIKGEDDARDAAHIASANPATILAILNDMTALVEALGSVTIYRVEDDDRVWINIGGVRIVGIADDGWSDAAIAALMTFDARARSLLARHRREPS